MMRRVVAGPELGARMRRADRFVRMAASAALDAWAEARREGGDVPRESVGLILASDWGRTCGGSGFWTGYWILGTGRRCRRISRTRCTGRRRRISRNCWSCAVRR